MSASRGDELRTRLRALRVFGGDLPVFAVEDAPEQPADLFFAWLGEAIDAGVPDPHAMTLSTVDDAGRPDARVLILKGLDDGRWQFATSRNSRKGQELAGPPWAAATFYWPLVGRQVRVRGRVMDDGAEAGAQDFLARPDGSRAESLLGLQSQVLRAEDDLDGALTEARERVEADPTLAPDHWARYSLVPDEVEFWQADRERRHVRLRYVLDADRWTQVRLWP